MPWYVALFGRDSLLITPDARLGTDVAADTLRLLAAYQGSRCDDTRDEQPGKILHELRVGERANLHEPPPSRTSGRWTRHRSSSSSLTEYAAGRDMELFRELRDNVDPALGWIERFGDSDGDGLIDYAGTSRHSFRNQGWKDSDNSIVNADGSLAEPPIALVEVQGYVYRAYVGIASLLRPERDVKLAEHLDAKAAGRVARRGQVLDNPRDLPRDGGAA